MPRPKAPSATRLAQALEAQTPWALWSQRPEPEQPWVIRGRYPTLASLEDELRAPLSRPEHGTLYRAARDGGARAHRLWVVGADGAIRRAPPVPADAPDKALDWLEAWEGDRARAPWMLRQCGRVSLQHLALAVCACVRSVLPRVPDGEERPLRAIEAAEGWCRGEVPLEVVKAASEAANALAETAMSSRVVTGPDSAYVAAVYASRVPYVRFPLQYATSAVSAAAGANEIGLGDDAYRAACWALAPVVRRYISLGMVLSGARV